MRGQRFWKVIFFTARALSLVRARALSLFLLLMLSFSLSLSLICSLLLHYLALYLFHYLALCLCRSFFILSVRACVVTPSLSRRSLSAARFLFLYLSSPFIYSHLHTLSVCLSFFFPLPFSLLLFRSFLFSLSFSFALFMLSFALANSRPHTRAPAYNLFAMKRGAILFVEVIGLQTYTSICTHIPLGSNLS